MTRAGGQFFEKQDTGLVQKRWLHYDPGQGHIKPGTEKIRFALYAFQGEHVTARNPVRRIYRLPVAALRALHRHPPSWGLALGALIGSTQFGVTFVTIHLGSNV
jgi:hypothetical protein